MSIKDLVTKKRKEELPAKRFEDNSLFSFQRDINRLFDNFSRGFELTPFGESEGTLLPAFMPKVNVVEKDKEVYVLAELPGMDEKDVSVEVDEDTLTLKGEKKEQHEEKKNNWHRIEQSYGSFHRVIPLPVRVDTTKAKANFKKGVLNVTLPKMEGEAHNRKTIEITSE
jgi:HSP20 family protein